MFLFVLFLLSGCFVFGRCCSLLFTVVWCCFCSFVCLSINTIWDLRSDICLRSAIVLLVS